MVAVIYPRGHSSFSRVQEPSSLEKRVTIVAVLFALGLFFLLLRFFQLQVLEHKTYQVLASDQHEVAATLVPRRGTIYLKDTESEKLFPAAKDRDTWLVFAMPREVKDIKKTAEEVNVLLNVTSTEVFDKLSSSSTYVVLQKDVSLEIVDALRAKRLPGIGVSKGVARLYPEQGLGGQMIGFVATQDDGRRVGKYGLEGAFEETLAGEYGLLLAEKDAAGRRLTIGTFDVKRAKDGSDIVLTIDRAIQYKACEKIQEAVRQFGASGGVVIIMNPQTGAILALCGAPDFDPANYGKINDLAVLNNPATFYQFEPGSIFKPITLSAALDMEKISPKTTYIDTGEEYIDGFPLRNSDKQAHGVQTMIDVLSKSLNTGTIFVERLLGIDVFRSYVERFGFGEKTRIGFQTEAKGDISPLQRAGKIWGATASYGQGISATPLQMVAAYAALGNGGQLMKPYLVQTIIHSDGTREETKPQVVRQVISSRTSRLISGMMVDVVENGHGKRAGVPGYYVAGKTGTAQIPNPHGKGYLKDENIGSFVGYAPADNPKFVMMVKIDRPHDVLFAESSAAPVFGDLAKFLLTYLQVPPER